MSVRPDISAETAAILTPDQRVRVFVSSTLREMAAERAAARAAIEALALVPVMFELGARPHPPRDLYRAYLEQSQIFIGIYGASYGWVAPGETVSGLEDEYNLAGTMPRLIYVSRRDDRDPQLAGLLNRIKADDGASYVAFTSPRDLRKRIRDDLAILLSERFRGAQLASDMRVNGPDLPVPASSLIGREVEIDEICDLLLRPDVRLVTLTGPGGIGKTRLGQEVARACSYEFADGALYVPLAEIADADRVADAVSLALGVRRFQGQELVDGCLAALAGKELLLVLDNFEHLLPAASFVGALLSGAPGLSALVTSRATLNLTGEWEYPVPPMSAPDADQNAIDEVANAPAVRLFVERAKAVRPSFALTDANVAAVGEITRRLDGLPLAIELAASRLRMMPVAAVREGLCDRLGLLTGGPRDVAPRQQTLRNAVAWSFDLLSPELQGFFARLSVFNGNFDLQAAGAVASADGSINVADALAQLVEKSLVVALQDEFRFKLLETLREFGKQILDERDETRATRVRHARHYVSTAMEAGQHLNGPDQTDWLARLDRDYANIRAAIENVLAMGDADLAVGFIQPLWNFWYLRGHTTEGLAWTNQALGMTYDNELRRGQLLMIAGILRSRQGDAERSITISSEAKTIFERSGLKPYLSIVETTLGYSKYNLARLDEAAAHFDRAAELCRETGLAWLLPYVLASRARILAAQGDFDSAMAQVDEAYALFLPNGDPSIRAFIATVEGSIRLARDETEGARCAFLCALDTAVVTANPNLLASVIEGAASLAELRGQVADAAVAWAVADHLRLTSNLPAMPYEEKIYARLRSRTETAQPLPETVALPRDPIRFAASLRDGLLAEPGTAQAPPTAA